jgi:hypothetical protein
LFDFKNMKNIYGNLLECLPGIATTPVKQTYIIKFIEILWFFARYLCLMTVHQLPTKRYLAHSRWQRCLKNQKGSINGEVLLALYYCMYFRRFPYLMHMSGLLCHGYLKRHVNELLFEKGSVSRDEREHYQDA